MKKLLHVFAVALLVVGSATFVPTQNAQAFFTSWMPWNWFDGGGWGGYPYYGGGYPYWGGGYPYYGGGYPYYGGGYPYYGGGYPYRGWW